MPSNMIHVSIAALGDFHFEQTMRPSCHQYQGNSQPACSVLCTSSCSVSLGQAYCAVANCVCTFAAQMANKMATKKLPTASITLVGSGIMHWSKDKQIDVIQGTPCCF